MTLQCPSKAPLPKRETRCGRRERESRREGRRENILPQNASTFAFDAVKGIPIFGKMRRFAAPCWNADLGRPATSCWFLQHEGRADDSGCPSDAEEGNVV